MQEKWGGGGEIIGSSTVIHTPNMISNLLNGLPKPILKGHTLVINSSFKSILFLFVGGFFYLMLT